MDVSFSPSDGSTSSTVRDDLVLWRYLDFPKFLDLLSTSTLKMPRASSMEDGYEGIPGAAARAASLDAARQRGEPGYLRNASLNLELKQAFFLRERTYVSCWNAFPQENAGLWRIYGDDKGLVIRTTWKSLRDSFNGTADCVSTVFFGPVKYRDFESDGTVSDTYTDQFFVKRSEFVHENEFRLIAHDESRDHDYNFPDPGGLPHFATLGCDLGVLIQEVLISPRLGPWVARVVSEVSQKYGGGWTVRQSELYQPPEMLSFEI